MVMGLNARVTWLGGNNEGSMKNNKMRFKKPLPAHSIGGKFMKRGCHDNTNNEKEQQHK
jgi:hypothetical protein